jgi:hypothetical protein
MGLSVYLARLSSPWSVWAPADANTGQPLSAGWGVAKGGLYVCQRKTARALGLGLRHHVV